MTKQSDARFLVAADGRNSSVARQLAEYPKTRTDRVALQTHFSVDAEPHVTLQLCQYGYLGLATIGEGLTNLCLVCRPATRGTLSTRSGREVRNLTPGSPLAVDHPADQARDSNTSREPAVHWRRRSRSRTVDRRRDSLRIAERNARRNGHFEGNHRFLGPRTHLCPTASKGVSPPAMGKSIGSTCRPPSQDFKQISWASQIQSSPSEIFDEQGGQGRKLGCRSSGVPEWDPC